MSETSVVYVGERRLHAGDRIERCRQVHVQLPRLPEVSHAGGARQHDALRRHAFRQQVTPRLCLDPGEQRIEIRPDGSCKVDGTRARIVAAQIGDQRAKSREVSRSHRDQYAHHLQFVGDSGGVHRSRPAIGQQREVAWIMAIGDGDLLDRRDHPRHGDADDATGERRGVESDALSQARDRRGRQPEIERDASGQRRFRRQPIEHEIGVGDRRFLAAFAVARRPRIGTRALRAHHQDVAGCQPRDRTAAGTHGVDFDLWRPVRVIADPLLIRHRDSQLLDQADIGASAAHVAGDQVGEAALRAKPHRGGNTTGGARQHGGNRQPLGPLRGGNAAVRRHDEQVVLIGSIAQRYAQRIKVASHQRTDIRVQHRGAEALDLAELRQHIGRRAHEAIGPRGLGACQRKLLVRGIGVAVQEADGNGDVGPVRNSGNPLVDLHGVDRLAHAAVEQQAFRHLERARPRRQRRRLQRAQIVQHGPVGPTDFQHVAEAPRHQHPDLGALLLKDRVGADGDAVADARDLIKRLAPELIEHCEHAVGW